MKQNRSWPQAIFPFKKSVLVPSLSSSGVIFFPDCPSGLHDLLALVSPCHTQPSLNKACIFSLLIQDHRSGLKISHGERICSYYYYIFKAFQHAIYNIPLLPDDMDLLGIPNCLARRGSALTFQQWAGQVALQKPWKWRCIHFIKRIIPWII